MDRPVTLPGNIGERPGLANRPGLRPGERPTTLPGDLTRPAPGDRPGLGNRPVDRPVTLPGDVGRPGLGNRPGLNNRPGNRWPNIGDVNVGNTVINSRPSWVSINNNRITQINVRWQSGLVGMRGWPARYPARINGWNRWGTNVRIRWNGVHAGRLWFGPSWWVGHPHGFCGWHYYHGFHLHPWGYWWTAPTFVAVTDWFRWSSPPPQQVWSEPVYYDYGRGGNVTYQDNRVYINGDEVATSDEFAQSAAALATVPPPATEEEAAAVEWMPLGTFAVTTDEQDVDPARIVQLAVSRQGVISGTLYNTQTDQAQTVQGQVDKDTQRVAMRLGESETVVAETGLYNLTQEEAPVLVHFGTEKAETWLFVRLDVPDGIDDEGALADDVPAPPLPGQ
jgi:hypothetical protein